MSEDFPEAEVKRAARSIVPEPGENRPQKGNWQEVYRAIDELAIPADLGTRAAMIASVKTEDFIAMMALLHAALAPDSGINPTRSVMFVRSPAGGDKRELVQPEQRMAIFERATELITRLASQRQAHQDQAFLERAGNVVGLAIVLAHPYEDGNGRTARTLAHLIRNGYDGSETLKRELETLGGNRPAQGFRINSYLPTAGGLDMSPAELVEAAAALSVSLDAKDVYAKSSRADFTTPYS